MKELIIRKQKSNHKGLDDTNHILCDENVLGAITGTFKKCESAFDIEHGIVYFYNNDNYYYYYIDHYRNSNNYRNANNTYIDRFVIS